MTEPVRLRILVVDDEADMRELLQDLLEDSGYEVHTAASGEEMRSALGAAVYSLVILDLRLKGEDGMQLARELRRQSSIPIMMLTGKGDETDRILGLEIAADDFLMKPFNNRELVARVRATLRRSTELSAPTSRNDQYRHERLSFDGWILDLSARTLARPDGKPEPLTGAEFTLLEALVKAHGRVLSRDQLLEATRGLDANVFDRTIDVLILRLRRKIEPNPRQPRYIRTERGLGYQFCEAVVQC
ncbi:DNA-binding response regulator OmpR [Marinobacterium lacunae]|uniref:DNA-binding response regulator OmpR n=1 Tax=Marinobacterium lacunae TaxID=1232683 RepID=A0A081FVU6_9GAMM|nr:response regulator [Marinobacterium lacunae]KEA62651.1 DNA-binding response regulator OmpR [Marinobacterium lacunae]